MHTTNVSRLTGKGPALPSSKRVTIDPRSPTPDGHSPAKKRAFFGRAFAKKSKAAQGLTKEFEKLSINPDERSLPAVGDSPSTGVSSTSLSHKSRHNPPTPQTPTRNRAGSDPKEHKEPSTPQLHGRRVILDKLATPPHQSRRHTFDPAHRLAPIRASHALKPQSPIAADDAFIQPVQRSLTETLAVLAQPIIRRDVTVSDSLSQIPGTISELPPRPLTAPAPTVDSILSPLGSFTISEARAPSQIPTLTRPLTAPAPHLPDTSVHVSAAAPKKVLKAAPIVELDESYNRLNMEYATLADSSALHIALDRMCPESITHMSFKNCEMSETALIDILKRPGLQYLDLTGTKLTRDAGHPSNIFRCIWLGFAPDLQTLKLGSWERVEFDCDHPEDTFKNLRVLDLTQVKCFGRHNLLLLPHFTSLVSLSLSGCNQIRDDDLTNVSGLLKLQKLYIGGCSRLTADGIHKLQVRRKLLVDQGFAKPITTLSLAESTHFDDRDIGHILSGFKDLTVLSLRRCTKIVGTCLDSIASPRIETIDLSTCINLNNEHQDAAVNYLLTLTHDHLTTVDLTNAYFVRKQAIVEVHERRAHLEKQKLVILSKESDHRSSSSSEIDHVDQLIERSTHVSGAAGAKGQPVAVQSGCCVIL
jgi:hypothetical protein